jgi:CII-binding regulator of phage lambda lysogenization HflD
LENLLSSQNAMVGQLTNRVAQLEQTLKEYKEAMESQQNKIKQLKTDLEKKEKNS